MITFTDWELEAIEAADVEAQLRAAQPTYADLVGALLDIRILANCKEERVRAMLQIDAICTWAVGR